MKGYRAMNRAPDTTYLSVYTCSSMHAAEYYQLVSVAKLLRGGAAPLPCGRGSITSPVGSSRCFPSRARKQAVLAIFCHETATRNGKTAPWRSQLGNKSRGIIAVFSEPRAQASGPCHFLEFRDRNQLRPHRCRRSSQNPLGYVCGSQRSSGPGGRPVSKRV